MKIEQNYINLMFFLDIKVLRAQAFDLPIFLFSLLDQVLEDVSLLLKPAVKQIDRYC